MTITESREWQLDMLRELRDERLALAESMRREAWGRYNRAMAALSDHPTEAGA